MRAPRCTIDSSCVIALDHLNLMPQLSLLFSRVLIPKAVREDLYKRRTTKDRIEYLLSSYAFLARCDEYERGAVLLGIAAVGVVVWLLAARSVSLLLDRVHTIRIAGGLVEQVRLDGGVIEVGGMRLDTLTTETMPSGLSFVLDNGGRVALTYQG